MKRIIKIINCNPKSSRFIGGLGEASKERRDNVKHA
jgi:hypothetical protein